MAKNLTDIDAGSGAVGVPPGPAGDVALSRRAGVAKRFAALWLVARNNLRRRPGQNILVGVMVAAASLLFAVALGVLGGLDRPFERMSEQAKASHFVLIVDADVYDSQALVDWWTAQPETVGVDRFECTVGNDLKPFFKGTQLQTMINYAEYRPDPVQDLCAIVDGLPGAAIAAGPGPGEVWVPTSLANQYGLKAGDVLDLPAWQGQRPYRIGAVVVDPQFSSGYVNPVRVWLAPGSLSVLYPPAQLRNEMVGVRLADPAQEDALWQRFGDHLGGAFNGVSFRYSMIRFGFTWMLRLVGTAMLAFSLLAGLACVLLVHSTISGAVRQDYRQIGILKSMGYTPAQTTAVYVFQYLAVALAALLPGAVLSWFLCGRMLQGLALALGVGAGTGQGALGPALLAVPVFLALVGFAAWLSGREAGRISAVAAIRQGGVGAAALGRRRPSRLWRGGLPPVVLLAVRSLGQHRRRSVAGAAALFFAAFIMVTSADTLALFSGIGDDLGKWGFVDSDISLVRNGRRFPVSHETLMADLAARPGVKAVVPQENLDLSIPARGPTAAMTIYGNVFDGDPTLVGQVNLAGRHPETADEISLGSITARVFGVETGDDITVFIFGQELKYRVVGVFQTVGNLGHGFRLTASGVRRANPGWEPMHYELMLKDPADRPAVVAALGSHWGEAVEIVDQRGIIRRVTSGMTAGLGGALLFMVLVFLGVAMAAVASGSAMDIHESLRSLALYKTMGYTPGQLRAAVALKFLALGLGASLAAVAANLVAGPFLLQAAMASFGVERVDWHMSWALAPTVLACGGFAALSTLGPSRRLRTIPVRNLIVE
jgi:putative ABC transport system permease protein